MHGQNHIKLVLIILTSSVIPTVT